MFNFVCFHLLVGTTLICSQVEILIIPSLPSPHPLVLPALAESYYVVQACFELVAVLFASLYTVLSKSLVSGFDFMSLLQQLRSGSASQRRSRHCPLLGPHVVVLCPGDLVSGDRWSSIRRSLRSLFSGHCCVHSSCSTSGGGLCPSAGQALQLSGSPPQAVF